MHLKSEMITILIFSTGAAKDNSQSDSEKKFICIPPQASENSLKKKMSISALCHLILKEITLLLVFHKEGCRSMMSKEKY